VEGAEELLLSFHFVNILDLGRALARETDLQFILQIVVAKMKQALRAERCSILTLATDGPEPKLVADEHTPEELSIPPEAIETVVRRTPPTAGWTDLERGRVALLAPLCALEDGRTAALYADRPERESPFTSFERSMLIAISVALDAFSGELNQLDSTQEWQVPPR
jgi:GAF domain-containing protein